ncbi:hypothetical protein [Metabacillus indicus]|uniref:hypothetical protein n=1 Tax=Metabacillus indicus TaxID=246786 RepID=UPI00049344FB|nr:hypothetical protein [Metabacillus indicus]KEZ51349.1 hypothetical protein AZ46_0212300 [Metabacillus indicus LMG 22858]
MKCNCCGQAAVKENLGTYIFIPCKCPIIKEDEERRYKFIKKRLDEAMASLDKSVQLQER